MTHLTLPFFVALAAAFVAALLLSAVPASTEALQSQAAPSPTPGVGGSLSLNGTTACGEGAGVTGRDCAGKVLEDATLQGGASFSADVPFAGAR